MTITDRARSVVAQMVNYQRDKVPITVRAADAPLPVTASKFGGVPYLPAGVDAPLGSDGQPLGMIAQINCAELPENTIYPESGMLQFWLNPRHPQWGMSINDGLPGADARVIYWEELGAANPHACAVEANWEEHHWPIDPPTREISLIFGPPETPEPMLTWGDHEQFIDIWNELYPDQAIEEIEELEDLVEEAEEDEDILSAIADEAGYHQLGGYPVFFDDDPRRNNPELEEYTVNLLTMGSESYRLGSTELLWGDAGYANWLITPEQLAARDFSNVLFWWWQS